MPDEPTTTAAACGFGWWLTDHVCELPVDHDGPHECRRCNGPAPTTTAAGELLPMDADPWDETPVTVPRGLLALLLNAAGKADEARLLGECPSDPCPTCTALVEIYEAVYPSAD